MSQAKKKVKPYQNPEAKRGFTTLQLLQLAALSIAATWRRRYREALRLNAQGKADEVAAVLAGLPLNEEGRLKALGGSTQVAAALRSLFGIQLPEGTKMKVTSALVEAGWFKDGKGDDAYRAVPGTPGMDIEAKRTQIFDYLFGSPNPAAAVLLTQENWLDPNPQDPSKKKGAATNTGAATALEDALTTSFSWGSKTSGKTFQDRVNAMQAVYQMTVRERDPEDNVRTGGVGQKKDASKEDADKRIAESNGFLADHVLDFLESIARKDARSNAKLPLQTAAAQRVAPLVRAAMGLGPGATKADVDAAVDRIKGNAAAIHQVFLNTFRSLGNEARDLAWRLLSTTRVNNLLGGHLITHPGTGRDKKFTWDERQQTVANPNVSDSLQFSRYVFDQLFNTYAARGAGGDKRIADAEKRASSGRRAAGPQGILGTDDKVFTGLSIDAPKKVANFVRKAAQGKYSMGALKLGANALGLQFDQGVVLHEVLIAAIKDYVVRRYEPNVLAGSADHITAVAAALGINGFSGIGGNSQLQQAGRAAILRKIDAMYGRFTSDCTADNYRVEDLKRIIAAKGGKVSDISTTEQACAALASVPRDQPSAQISGQREETTTARPVSQARSGRRADSAAGPALLQGLARPLSAGTQAAFTQWGARPTSPRGQPGTIGGTRLPSPGQPGPQFPGATQGPTANPFAPTRQPTAGRQPSAGTGDVLDFFNQPPGATGGPF